MLFFEESEDFGDKSSVADTEIPQELLKSGKFVQVCKLVESLAGAKKPSSRESMEKVIKSLQKEVKVDQKSISTLFDRYFRYFFT